MAGPLRWGRLPHAELEEAFLKIGRDRDNKVVILTGTGDEFSGPRADPTANRKYHKMTPDEWGELGWESKGRRVSAVHMTGHTSPLNRGRLDMANEEYVVMQSIGHDRREFISKSFCLAGTASF